MSRVTPLCYGKLPIFPEFIRHGATATDLAFLDRWLQEGMVQAEARLGPAWVSAFEAAAPARFLVRPPESTEEFVGVIAPSRDQAGRIFPFMIFSAIAPELRGSTEWVLPLRYESFLDQAESLMTGDALGADVDSVRRQVDALAMDLGADGARSSVEARLQQGTTGELWGELFGEEAGVRPHLLLRNFSDLVMQKRPPPYVLRFPRVETAADASFWLAATARLRPADLAPGFVAWCTTGGEPSRSLRVLLDDPQGKHLLPLMLPEADKGDACVLATEGEDDERYSEESRLRFAELVADDQMSLHRLLTELEMRGRAQD